MHLFRFYSLKNCRI